MTVPLIKVVAGPAGSGKTAWIHQQIQDTKSVDDDNIIYFSPGTGNVSIDKNRMTADFPGIQVFSDTQEVELLKRIPEAKVVYIELGFYLDLGSLSAILNDLSYRTVAVLPPHLKDSEYHAWADEVISGVPIIPLPLENYRSCSVSLQGENKNRRDAENTEERGKERLVILDRNRNKSDSSNHLWRVGTDTQVIDEDSLEEFWYELTHGAYGNVSRAKAIFDVNDGRSIYCDFVAGIPQAGFLELNLPRHLEGRPQRFSGIEVLGESLDEVTLKQTLSDCFLSDLLVKQFQQQVKQMLLEGMQV
ncbi:GTP-binding protein [Plectonema radiosum]|uniref:GTP-binding protein n=1 Tax=Plectonema radiosum TaxID=945768 RepID=UPI001D156261|nr:GTP-binding protein [Plectonema radiosum]